MPEPTRPGGAPTSDYGSNEEWLDLQSLARALRRRWWLIAIAVVLAISGAWYYQMQQVDQYTASALLQKEAEGSPLLGLGTAMAGSRGDADITAQLEVIRSNTILRPVVDSLGLRLVVREPEGGRSALFEEVRVEPNAPPGEYRLRKASVEAFVLEDIESDRAVAKAEPGSWLEGLGFAVQLGGAASVGEAAIEILPVDLAIAALRQQLSLQQVSQTSLIRIRYTDPDPELAAAVVGAVAAVYQEYRAREAREEARRRRVFIGDQLAVIADSLGMAQSEQLEYQERAGILNPEAEGGALIAALMEAEAEVRIRRYQESTLASVARSLQTPGEAEDALRRAVALGSDLVPGAESLYARLRDLQAERSRLTASRYGYTAEGGEVEVVDSLIADTRQELGAMSRQALDVARTRRAAAEERLMELREEVRAVPERNVGFARLRQQAEAVQSTYALLAGKFYEAQIAEAVEGGDIRIVDPPTVPPRPEPTYPLRTFLLALMLGIVVGTAGALGLDQLDRRVREGEDAKEATGLPILSAIPLTASANGATRPTLVRSERSPMAEAFRSLYTMIRFSRAEWPRVIAVVSTEPAAGKSTVAANLALVMAGNHPRVLVVDADLARPIQHQTFGLPLQPGLSDVLVGESAVEDVIRRDQSGGVDVITAGTPVPHSGELLGSDAFRDLVRRLSAEYDVVIVDTAPVMAVADTSAIAPAMDGILLVARLGSTDRDALSAAAEQLRQVGGNLLGLVLNGASAGAGYGPGYGYGSKYADYAANGAEPEGTSTALSRIRRLLTGSKAPS